MKMMVGLMVAIMGIMIFIGAFPAVVDVFIDLKGNDNFNCPNYLDTDATTAVGGTNNRSYDSSASGNTNGLGCTVVDFGPAFLILGALIGIITFILYGSPQAQAAPQFGGNPYGGY